MLIGRIATEHGSVIVTLNGAQLSLREYSARGQASDGRRGITLSPHPIPLLRAALERAEAEALSRGLITADDYVRLGLELPAQLR